MKSNKKKITRRKFIKKSSIGAAAISSGFSIISSCSKNINEPIPEKQIQKKSTFPIHGNENSEIINQELDPMPKRTLGNTGLEVSLLAFGGGSRFQWNTTNWEEEIERAVELGVNVFDTSTDYGFNAAVHSEARYGTVLPKYRDKVIVSTKLNARDGEGAKREFEKSIGRLKVDYVDILLIHQLAASDSLSQIENGIYKQIVKYKNEGTAKFIGFSVMTEDTIPLAKALIENLDIDVIIGVINPFGKNGNVHELLPLIQQKNIGLIAMKLMRDIVVIDPPLATPKETIEYALSQQGVCSAVVGHTTIDVLEENVNTVKQYDVSTGIYKAKNLALEKRFQKYAGNYIPVWARPGYRDGSI